MGFGSTQIINKFGKRDKGFSKIDNLPVLTFQMAYEDLETMGYEIEWLDLAWAKRIPLSINSSQIPTTQTNFPLLINSIFTDLIGETEAELRFTGINNVQLKYEIQKFDSITGELIAWVKMPTISDGDIIHIYYDNPAAIDEQNPAAVWDANYKSVYHMQSDGKDSTVNTQNLTQFGTALTPVTGKIGNGADYGGTINDYSIRNPFAGFPLNEITVEIWLNSVSTGEGLLTYFTTTINGLAIFEQQSIDYILFATLINGGSVLNDGLWHQIALTWKSSTGKLDIYIDGTFFFSVNVESGSIFSDGDSLVLAQSQNSIGGGFGASYTGTLDETRISDNIRSADYVTTSYNNQNNPSTFYSIGTIEIPAIPDIMVYEN